MGNDKREMFNVKCEMWKVQSAKCKVELRGAGGAACGALLCFICIILSQREGVYNKKAVAKSEGKKSAGPGSG